MVTDYVKHRELTPSGGIEVSKEEHTIMAPPNIKGVKVMDALNNNPGMTDYEVAKLVGCTVAYVRNLRKKMVHVPQEDSVYSRIEANRHEVPAHQQHLIKEDQWDGNGERSWCEHGIDELREPCEACWLKDADAMEKRVAEELDFNDAPTQEELDVVLEAASILNPTSLDAVLKERGSRYGSFLNHAVITQRLKAVMADTPNWIALNDDMVESLEMIAHKIGRILNGDPTYADSWVDIAGYAQLVADRLQGKEQ